jgi:hypothetical protein
MPKEMRLIRLATLGMGKIAYNPNSLINIVFTSILQTGCFTFSEKSINFRLKST